VIGVLVMAHGTPSTAAEIEPFYTRIRRGRAPSAAQLAELTARYEAIGGTSPLAAHTAAQVDALAAVLDDDRPARFAVRFGAKHTDPDIESAATGLAGSGVEDVVGLVLTPHRSASGSDQYHERARAALDAGGVRYTPLHEWFAAPGFVALQAERVAESRDPLVEGFGAGARVAVVFSAHSVPASTVADGDPYPAQVAESAALVAAQCGVDDFTVAWQSAGRTPDPWIGPALGDVLADLAAAGARAVVVCPIGFVADHLEVLYDLDIEARAVAAAAGLHFSRTRSLNDDPRFIRVLADAVESAAVAA
jgi:ferrochelatase